MDSVKERETRSLLPAGVGSLIEGPWLEPRLWFGRDEFLAMDMYETDEGLVIEVALPGVAQDDLKLNVLGDTLTLEGELKRPTGENVSYLAQERTYGRFRRSIQLPQIHWDKIDATLEKGILRVMVARPEEERPRSIRVKTKK